MKRLLGLVLMWAPLIQFESGCSKSIQATVSVPEQAIIEAVLADDEARPSATRGLYETASTNLFTKGLEEYSSWVQQLRQEGKYHDVVFQNLVEEFIRVNASETVLRFPNHLPNTVVMMAGAKGVGPVRKLMNAIRKRRFGLDTTFEVSQPAIDIEHNIALIAVSYHKGAMSAAGGFYILTFDGGKWRTDKTQHFGPSWMT